MPAQTKTPASVPATSKKATKPAKTAGKKKESNYAKQKRITRQAFELIASFKYKGEKGMQAELESFDAETRKQSLRKALTEANDPEVTKALDALVAAHFPEGLSTRGSGEMPKQLKAMTTKQRKKPFVICRLPDSFAARAGSMVDVEVRSVKGGEIVVLSMGAK